MIYKHNGFLISNSKNAPSTYSIATEGKGGKIPNVLTGSFTSVGVAQSHIDRYLESKVKADAKTSDESGSK